MVYFKNVFVKVAQSCPTLCDPMDYTVHGILQARILEWVDVPFSRGPSWPGIKLRFPALQVDSWPAELLGKPLKTRLLATKEKCKDSSQACLQPFLMSELDWCSKINKLECVTSGPVLACLCLVSRDCIVGERHQGIKIRVKPRLRCTPQPGATSTQCRFICTEIP